MAAKNSRSIIISLVNSIFTWAVSFFVLVKLPQYLGARNFGEYCLASSIPLIISPLVGLGLSPVLSRSIGRDRSSLSNLALSAICARTIMALVSILIGWLVCALLGYSRLEISLTLMLLGSTIFAQVGEVMGACLIGLQQAPKQSLAVFIDKLVSSAAILILIYLKAPLWSFAAISIAAAAAASLAYYLLIRPQWISGALPKLTDICNISRQGFPFMLMGLLVAFYGQIDPPILRSLCGPESIGQYSIGGRLVGAALFFPVALCNVMLPSLSRAKEQAPQFFELQARKMYRLTAIVSLPFAVALVCAPGSVIRALNYPHEYNAAVHALTIFGIGIFAWSLSQVSGTILIAKDLQNCLTRYAAICAILAFPFCWLSVYVGRRYFGDGVAGAAFSDVASELFLLTAYVRTAGVRIIEKSSLIMMGKAVVASIPLGVLLHGCLTSSRGSVVFALGALGIVIYGTICALLGVVTREDLAPILNFAKLRGNA